MRAGRANGLRTVVFDLDGTLADTSADLLAAANACFRDLGLGAPLGPGDAVTAFQGGRAMLRLGFARAGAPWDEGTVSREYPNLLAAYAAVIDRETTLYPGAVAAVEQLLAEGYRCAICTNKPEGLAEVLLSRLGLRPLFHALVGADTLPVRKPDPLPYRTAVERAGGQVTRSLLVGDTATDRETARAAGVPAVLVTFGPEGEAVSRLKPEALLHRFSDLPGLAARLII
jgi:phosphoglycolate phosphatase